MVSRRQFLKTLAALGLIPSVGFSNLLVDGEPGAVQGVEWINEELDWIHITGVSKFDVVFSEKVEVINKLDSMDDYIYQHGEKEVNMRFTMDNSSHAIHDILATGGEYNFEITFDSTGFSMNPKKLAGPKERARFTGRIIHGEVSAVGMQVFCEATVILTSGVSYEFINT